MAKKLFPDPFLKNQKATYLWINNSLKALYSLFLLYADLRAIEIVKPSCRPLAFTLYNAFLKTKRGLGLVTPSHFQHDFLSKTFLLLSSVD